MGAIVEKERCKRTWFQSQGMLRVTVECENNSVPDVPANLETSLTTESDSCKNEDTIEKLKDDISQLQAKNMDLQTKYDKDMNITMWFVSVRTISRQRQ